MPREYSRVSVSSRATRCPSGTAEGHRRRCPIENTSWVSLSFKMVVVINASVDYLVGWRLGQLPWPGAPRRTVGYHHCPRQWHVRLVLVVSSALRAAAAAAYAAAGAAAAAAPAAALAAGAAAASSARSLAPTSSALSGEAWARRGRQHPKVGMLYVPSEAAASSLPPGAPTSGALSGEAWARRGRQHAKVGMLYVPSEAAK